MRMIRVLVVVGLLLTGCGWAGSAWGQEPVQEPKPATEAVAPGKPVVKVPASFLQNAHLPMVVKTGAGERDNVLAMNISGESLPKMREVISKTINRPLLFAKDWNPEGEAHIKVIYPLEYSKVLVGPNPSTPLVSMDDIARIAEEHKLQESDVSVLAVGSSMKKVEGKLESVFFLIVKSENLLKIRRAVDELFVQRGGTPGAFSPNLYDPHVTIGYTKRDLDGSDRVVKTMEHSEDRRFVLQTVAAPEEASEAVAGEPQEAGADEATGTDEAAGSE